MLWRPLRVAAILSLTWLVTPAVFAQGDDGPCTGDEAVIGEWDVVEIGGEILIAEGTMTRARIECRADGRLRHLIEISEDGGRTWTSLFDGLYSPMVAPMAEAAAPSTSPPPAVAERAASESEAPAPVRPPDSSRAADTAEPPPADEPTQHQAVRQASQEGSEVNAVSRVLQRDEIAQEAKPELHMASPLVLEIVPGEVDRYPEGTAWQTDETAGFIVNDVILKKISLGRKAKGDSVDLLIGSTLYSSKRLRNADVFFEALVDGNLVGSAQMKKVRVGLSIPGHGKKGMLVETSMRLSREVFDSVFEDDAEPMLRVTITSPSGS